MYIFENENQVDISTMITTKYESLYEHHVITPKTFIILFLIENLLPA